MDYLVGAKWECSHPCERRREISYTRRRHVKEAEMEFVATSRRKLVSTDAGRGKKRTPEGPGGSTAPLTPGLQWFWF